MEVCIVPLQKVKFNLGKNKDENPKLLGAADVKILPKSDSSETEHQFCSMLENSLIQDSLECKTKKCWDDKMKNGVLISLCLTPTESIWCVSMFNNGISPETDNIFLRLINVCGTVNFTFNLRIEFKIGKLEKKIEAKDLPLVQLRRGTGNTKLFAGIRHTFKFQYHVSDKILSDSSKVMAAVSLRIRLTDETVKKIYLENGYDPQTSIDRSPAFVFKAMFESILQIEHGVTTTIAKIPEITDCETGVRALLGYLYYWKIEEISESCSTAWEVLQAADKFKIPKLEKNVIDMILCKDNDWFTPSIAIQLFQFARKKVGGDLDFKKIEEKCIAVLKSKSGKELSDCSEFQQLFMEPEDGMEFCCYLLYSK